jgi:hypothetical protein
MMKDFENWLKQQSPMSYAEAAAIAKRGFRPRGPTTGQIVLAAITVVAIIIILGVIAA